MRNIIYISKSLAEEAGATHEGTIWGVPVWIFSDNRDQVLAAAKLPVLELYMMACELLFTLFLAFRPADESYLTPIKIGRKISDV